MRCKFKKGDFVSVSLRMCPPIAQHYGDTIGRVLKATGKTLGVVFFWYT